MSDKSPVEQALDLFVYAPLGLVLSAGEELPRLAEKGRAQATMARMVGQFVVTQGRREAEKAMGGVGERLAEVVGDFLGSPAPRPAPAAEAAPVPAAPAPAAAPAAAAAPPTRSSNGSGPAPSAAALAIPGYDSLAASQVVQRLAGLSGAELEAVRAYEEATRHRKTILNRVAQLQNDPST